MPWRAGRADTAARHGDVHARAPYHLGVPARAPLPFDPIAEAREHWLRAGWPGAADGMALVTSVMRAHQILLRRVDAVLAEFGITFARFEVLMLLTFSRRGRLPLGKLGQRLQVHATSVTNAIDRLEQDGLVRREPHPSDGRTTLAVLTPKGRALARRAVVELNAHVFEQTGLDDVELRAAIGSLAHLRERAGDFA